MYHYYITKLTFILRSIISTALCDACLAIIEENNEIVTTHIHGLWTVCFYVLYYKGFRFYTASVNCITNCTVLRRHVRNLFLLIFLFCSGRQKDIISLQEISKMLKVLLLSGGVWKLVLVFELFMQVPWHATDMLHTIAVIHWRL